MKLIDALRIVNASSPTDGRPFEVSLACGFTPLHLKTYLAAHLRLAHPYGPVEVATGLFDDLVGNLERTRSSPVSAIAVVIEWADVDPRLGVRRVGGWRVEDVTDIEDAVALSVARLERALEDAAQCAPMVVALPTLPLPPLFHHRPDESGEHELRIRARIADLAATLARHKRIRVCSAQRLDELSPMDSRRDLKAELSSGFPYSTQHACVLAESLSNLLRPATPKKGLITDLDATLWSGIVGELGASGVSWSLDEHAQRHALYQQLLASLASDGVLIAIASKNELGPVAEALRREDLLVPQESLFPVEVNWGAKSDSVRRILDTWNLSPADVVMVDDSPLELAEVQAAFPQITTLEFPSSDDDGVWRLLRELRGLFGKGSTTAEDRLRVSSLRARQAFHASAAGASGDDFLASVAGSLEITIGDANKARALELFNKTNQFNLNGIRLTEADLDRALARDGATLTTVAYDDRFGPLGTIAAILTRQDGSTLVIDSWVMSCRAFSRRIEHHCLRYLFERFDVEEIAAAYSPTDRNAPLREFLAPLLAPESDGTVGFTRATFEQQTPALVHRVLDSGVRTLAGD